MEIFHQLMYLHFIFVLNKRLIWVANTVFSSFWRSGSSSRREEAIREASFRIKASFPKLATFKLQAQAALLRAFDISGTVVILNRLRLFRNRRL